MSHFTRVRTQLRDLETVKQALKDLGFAVRSGEVRGYGGQQIHADVVVRLDGGYDIGFRKDGQNVTMIVDLWGLKIHSDEFLAKLTQRYAYRTVLEQATDQGWQVVGEESQPDGSIKLVVERWR
jgi:Protein of unknown function (DUF1257)